MNAVLHMMRAMSRMNNPQTRSRLAVPVLGGSAILGTLLYYSTRPRKPREQQAAEKRALRHSQGVLGAGVGAGNSGALGGFELGQPGSGHDSPSVDPSRRVETTAPQRGEGLPQGGVGGGEAAPRDVNFPGLDRGQIGRDEGGVAAMFSTNKPYDAHAGGDNGGDGGDVEKKGKKGEKEPAPAVKEGNTGEEDAGKGLNSSTTTSKDTSKDSNDSRDTSTSSNGNADNSSKTGKAGKTGKTSSGPPASSEGNSASQTLQGLFGQGGPSCRDRDESDRFHDTKIASNMADTPTKKGARRV